MTIDRRFPWMVHLDRITPRHGAAAERSVREICHRTNCNAVYDLRSESAHFYLGSNMAFGVCACPVGGQWDSARIDKQVKYILRGRMPAALKDREIELAEQEEREKNERERARISDDLRPDLKKDAKRRLDQMDMGRHWKGRALVQGSK